MQAGVEVPVQFFYDDFDRDPTEAMSLQEPPAEEVAERRNFLEVLATPEGMRLCRAFSEVGDQAVRRRIVDLVRALAEAERKKD